MTLTPDMMKSRADALRMRAEGSSLTTAHREIADLWTELAAQHERIGLIEGAIKKLRNAFRRLVVEWGVFSVFS
jgi:hypothetical protein